MGEAVTQPHRPIVRCQRVAPAHQRTQGLVTGIEWVQLRRGWRLQDQGEIRFERNQGGHRLRVVAHLYREAHLRETGAVGFDLLRHDLRDEGLAAGERHVAPPHP